MRSQFPSGWNEKRVRQVLAHYEQQNEEETVAEDEAAFEQEGQAIIAVPNELLPKVRELIAQHESALIPSKLVNTRPIGLWIPRAGPR